MIGVPVELYAIGDIHFIGDIRQPKATVCPLKVNLKSSGTFREAVCPL